MPIVRLQSASLESTPSNEMFDSIIQRKQQQHHHHHHQQRGSHFGNSGSLSNHLRHLNNNHNSQQTGMTSDATNNMHRRKRIPMDPVEEHSGSERGSRSLKGGKHTFSTLVESLSHSSDEMLESIKSFGLFKSSSSSQQQEVVVIDETRPEMFDDDDRNDVHTTAREQQAPHWTAIPVMESTERDKLMSPTERTRQLLDNLGISSSEPETETTDSSSLLRSMKSPGSSHDSDEEDDHHDDHDGSATETTSWDDGIVRGSREMSLLDDTTSVGTSYANGVDDDATEFDDDDDDATAYSHRTVDTDEYVEDNALQVLGGVIYNIGSCNFSEVQEILSGGAVGASFDDDEFSVRSDAFPQLKGINRLRRGRSTTPRSLGPNAAAAQVTNNGSTGEDTPGLSILSSSVEDRENQSHIVNGMSSTFDVVREDPPRKKSFFQSLFSCH